MKKAKFIKKLSKYLVKKDQYLALNLVQAKTLAKLTTRFLKKKDLKLK